MVLVSKLRGSSEAKPGATNSFLNKIRSTFTRSSSSSALNKGSDVTACRADSYSRVEKFVNDKTLLCDSPVAKRSSKSHDPCEWPVDDIVALSDLAPDIIVSESKINVSKSPAPISICGTQDDEDAADAEPLSPARDVSSESELDAEPLSPARELFAEMARGLVAQLEPADEEELPGFLSEEPAASLVVEAKPQQGIPSEVKRRLWDPADPPHLSPKAHPAWQMKRDTQASGPQGSKGRFPARLPPLSGLSSKSLRKLTGNTSTPVLHISSLPEPEPLQA